MKNALLSLLLVLPSLAAAKEIVVTSPQLSPPDGYVTIPKDAPWLKIEKGKFKYCLGIELNLLTEHKCQSYGTADEYIRTETNNPNATYVGMGVHSWGAPILLLFYSIK